MCHTIFMVFPFLFLIRGYICTCRNDNDVEGLGPTKTTTASRFPPVAPAGSRQSRFPRLKIRLTEKKCRTKNCAIAHLLEIDGSLFLLSLANYV